MKGYISMILEGSYGTLATKQKTPLESIFESNERLIRLVNDLLNVSRIEAGRVEMKWEQGSVEEIIKSVIEELRIKTKEKNVELVFEEPESSLPLIRIDKEKIRNVVLNVVDNAIRYTPQGNIVVNAKCQMSNLLISVKDTGEGMTQEEMGKLFQTFSRGGAGMRFSTEGAGLGLYIAKKFVEMHKGRIWVESQGKGQGSTFFVELPVA
jgi:signal transduction histidine kinase